MTSVAADPSQSPGLAAAQATPAPSREDRKLQEAKDALNTLKAVKVSASSQQKSSAKMRLDALKQRLKMLMMISGGDPKALARAAAQLAKEIAQAAKDYAAAGGSPSDVAAAAPAPQAPTPAGADRQASVDQAPGAMPADQTAPPAEGAGQDATGGEQPKPEAAPAQAATPSSQGGDPAIEEAKQLATGARALLQRAIARAKQEHPDKAQDFKDEQAAMTQADKDIADAAKTAADAGAPAAYGPAGQPIAATPAASPPATATTA